MKTGDKPNEYVPVQGDLELMTEFEKGITTGRYLLSKKHKFNL